MIKLEEKVDKLDDIIRSLADTQSTQTVLLQNVLKSLEEEAKNSTRISVLETNWIWVRGIVALMIIPILFLTVEILV
tara:strand:- start:1124 stop:1354 length:231 start_codon:yes stop_codon:yes gene_type:complete